MATNNSTALAMTQQVELEKRYIAERLKGTPDWDLGAAIASGQSSNRPRRELIDMVRDRWEMSISAKYPVSPVYCPCPAVYCHSTGERVFVVVASPSSCELIEDEVCIFPSDALMARIHLAASHGNK